MEKKVVLFGEEVYGRKVSKYGLKHGYLDYKTLSNIVGDCILNNNIRLATGYQDWELASGKDYFGLDEDGRECDIYDEKCVEEVPYEIYQEYIVSPSGAKFLFEYTDEIVYYNAEIDLYLWAVTHYGTSWDYVLTDLKLISLDEYLTRLESDKVKERINKAMDKRKRA